jgi:hypothetical protein
MDSYLPLAWLLLLTALVWLLAALLQWHNLRKQEYLLVALERAQFRPAIRSPDREFVWETPAQPPSEEMACSPRGRLVP